MAGTVRAEWNGHAISEVKPALAQGLQDWADMLKDAAEAAVPVLTGSLRDTAKATVDEDSLEGAVSFNHAYAVRQHEAMDFHHDNGQAKYLEQPLNETQREGLQLLAAAVRSRLG